MMMEALSGNQGYKTSFLEAAERHVDNLQDARVEVLVADSGGYSTATLQALEVTGVTYMMSVPATIVAAKNLLEGLTLEDLTSLAEGYEAH